MKKLKMGARVGVTMVQNDGDPTEISPPAKGRVVRLLNRDDGAWVALDQRQEKNGVHPFPAGDEVGRGTWVMTYPEYCNEASP